MRPDGRPVPPGSVQSRGRAARCESRAPGPCLRGCLSKRCCGSRGHAGSGRRAAGVCVPARPARVTGWRHAGRFRSRALLVRLASLEGCSVRTEQVELPPRGAGDTGAVCPSCRPVNPGTTGHAAGWCGAGCNEPHGPGSASRSDLQAAASPPPGAGAPSRTGGSGASVGAPAGCRGSAAPGRRLLLLPASISIITAAGERTEPAAEAAA